MKLPCWAPATSGNYSVRLDDGRIAITISGRHKGRLSEDDVMTVDAAGRALDGQRPSAETPLHAMLYAGHPTIGAASIPVSPKCSGTWVRWSSC